MREKILNLSFYFGFVPFYRIACALKGRECRRSKHYYQALAISGITFIGFIAFVVSFGIHSLIFLYSPDIALKLPLELSFYVLTTFILVSVGLIMDGVTGVIMGHNPRIPLHAWISSSNIRVIATTVIMIVQILVIIIGVFVIIHSTKIVEDSSDKTEIYMLYDDMGYVPRWV
jgi:magnesium-transporting ATPase (P-type)